MVVENLTLYLYFYKFNTNFAKYYCELLQKKITSNELVVTFEEGSLFCTLKCNSLEIVKECISYIMYSTHPFYHITDSSNTSIISTVTTSNLTQKKYNLYHKDEHKENLFYYLEQLFQIHIYLKSVFNTFQEDLEQVKKLSFVNPYTTSNTHAIETSLLYDTHHYNISLRNQFVFEHSKILPAMINDSFNIFKEDLVETINQNLSSIENEKLNKNLIKFARFQISNHTIVQNDMQLKQLKEESLKAGIKMKISIFNFDYLDVKFIKNQFDVCISSFLTIDNKDEFNELISQYLYQGEFISSKCISVLTLYEISPLIFRKFKLKVVKKKRIIHNSKEILLYIIARK
ncbi:MAG: hypothetical protein LAT82_00520 [Nanoarchaeota archaeon]|nr:hypothetical protein [Nanoarchaeota archaeon]